MGERTIMGNSKETVSDMLRRCVDESEARRISPFAIACEKLGIDTSLGHVKCERSVYRRMAGEIDRELAMARLEGNEAYGTLREFMRVYSILLEKPMSDDEDLEGWLEHWFVPKPVGDDGEPVQLGDTVVDKLRGEMFVTRMSWVGKGVYFNGSHNVSGKKLRTSRIAYAPGERVKRPNPQVLDKDGVPIEVGDAVYWKGWNGKWRKRTVSRIDRVHESVRENYPNVASAVYFNDMDWMPNNRLTHREPDSIMKVWGKLTDLAEREDSLLCDEIAECASRLGALMDLDGVLCDLEALG